MEAIEFIWENNRMAAAKKFRAARMTAQLGRATAPLP
jgi:hypothetical protein